MLTEEAFDRSSRKVLNMLSMYMSRSFPEHLRKQGIKIICPQADKPAGIAESTQILEFLYRIFEMFDDAPKRDHVIGNFWLELDKLLSMDSQSTTLGRVCRPR